MTSWQAGDNDPIVAVTESQAGFGFRNGIPKFPLRMDAIYPDDPHIPLLTNSQREAVKILDEAEIDFDDVQTLKVAEAKQAELVLALQIRVPDRAQASQWRWALIKISRMLDVLKAPPLRVFLYVTGSDAINKTFAISADDRLVEVWSSIKDSVLQLFQDVDFVEIGVWYWGRTRGTAKPTILVVVHDETSIDVKHRTDEALAICLPHGFGVEFIEGSFMGCSAEYSGGDQQGYAEKVPMGHSIGVENGGECTMGGYLKLTSPKDKKDESVFFLTDWHVVQNGNSSVVHSPSTADFDAKINAQRMNLKDNFRMRN